MPLLYISVVALLQLLALVHHLSATQAIHGDDLCNVAEEQSVYINRVIVDITKASVPEVSLLLFDLSQKLC